MGERSEYKSSIRSRRLIRGAFVELLVEKDIEKITVTDIVKRAEINRGTFYAHYQDIRELYEQIENDVVTELSELLAAGGLRGFYGDPRPVLRELTAFLGENRKYYAALLSSKAAKPLLARLSESYAGFLAGDTSFGDGVKASPEFRLRHVFVSSGIYNIYREWLTGWLDISDDELVTLTSELVFSCRMKDELSAPDKD